MGGNTGDDLASLRQSLDDDGISNCGSFLLVCGANPGKDDDLLDGATVLLIDPHDVEKPIDSDESGSGNAGNSGIIDGHGKVVGLETPSKTTNGYLTQDTHLAGDLGFQYHSDADTFSVKNRRGQNSLDGMADGMAKVDKIA